MKNIRSIDAEWEKPEVVYIDTNGKDFLLVTEENGTETWFYHDKSLVSINHIINERIGKFFIDYFRDGNIEIKCFEKSPALSKTDVYQNRVVMKFKDGKMLDGPSLISYCNETVISIAYFKEDDTFKTVSCFRHGEIKVGTYDNKTLLTNLVVHSKGGVFYSAYANDLDSIGPNFA